MSSNIFKILPFQAVLLTVCVCVCACVYLQKFVLTVFGFFFFGNGLCAQRVHYCKMLHKINAIFICLIYIFLHFFLFGSSQKSTNKKKKICQYGRWMQSQWHSLMCDHSLIDQWPMCVPHRQPWYCPHVWKKICIVKTICVQHHNISLLGTVRIIVHLSLVRLFQ